MQSSEAQTAKTNVETCVDYCRLDLWTCTFFTEAHQCRNYHFESGDLADRKNRTTEMLALLA